MLLSAVSSPKKEGQIPVLVPRKRSHRILAVFLLTLFLVVAGILLEGLLVKLPIISKCADANERVGVIHVHTRASDGSGTVAEVMAAAEKANLSFIAITDHNVAMTESDLAEDPPDLPIISGVEVGTAAGHFLALGIPPSWVQPKTNDDRTLLAAARAAGAFRILAHPFHPHAPWTDWKTSDFEGMEIWNEDAAWRQNNFFDLMDAFLLYGENDQLAFVRLASTPEQNFAKWDELLQQRPIAGLCAADTHARIRLGFSKDWRFPGYEPSLKVAREHVLFSAGAGGGNPALASAAEIVDALKTGHSYCALDSLYPADGFSFRVSSVNGSGGPGDFLHWTGAARIQISAPSGANLPLIKIFRDGREIDEELTRNIDEPISGPGRYRTEVFLRQPGLTGWRRWTLWVFTNPVYVTAQ
jgi:PHP domain-containing protein